MDELTKVLKALLPGNSEQTYKSIVTMLGLEGKEVVTSDEGKEDTVTISQIATSLKSLGYDVKLPGLEVTPKTQKSFTPPYEGNPIQRQTTPDEDDDDDDDDEGEDRKKNITKAFHINQLGDTKEARKMIMRDAIGQNHQQLVYDQNVAFSKYIRGGERGLDNKELKLLGTQFFPEEHIVKAVLEGGFDVATIKATQIEAQGELGGIAVPPNRQNEITTRLPGLTAVRGAGANVITLVNSNSIEIPQWKSSDTTKQRYIGTIRGEWGNETKMPSEQNFKMELVPVVANIYTYKVPMSMSLVEDASNVVTMLMNDIAITMAMDEDTVFLVGDGVGKPEGILPGGLNAHALREVTTGDSDELTPRGIKALKRAIASQYRRNCVWVAQSDTYGIIESMREDSGAGANTGQFLFKDLSDDETLLNRPIYESEEMPEVAANAFPLLFGWMMGYDIVERLGMTIQRFHDSGTGINKVQYEVRKRVGGKLERPWLFALQKVATGDPFS